MLQKMGQYIGPDEFIHEFCSSINPFFLEETKGEISFGFAFWAEGLAFFNNVYLYCMILTRPRWENWGMGTQA